LPKKNIHSFSQMWPRVAGAAPAPPPAAPPPRTSVAFSRASENSAKTPNASPAADAPHATDTK
jgi:hypothetical protein